MHHRQNDALASYFWNTYGAWHTMQQKGRNVKKFNSTPMGLFGNFTISKILRPLNPKFSQMIPRGHRSIPLLP